MNIKAIHSGVRAVGRLYLPGDEKELQKAITDEQANALAAGGAIDIEIAPVAEVAEAVKEESPKEPAKKTKGTKK